MLMKYNRYLFFLILVFSFTSCLNDELTDFPVGEVSGYRPIYETEVDMTIEFGANRNIVNPGQIYVLNGFLLLNDIGKGIHVIDNTDPSRPTKLGFLQVAGSENMAIKDGVLYVNQYNELVAIDISDLNNIEVVSRNLITFENSLVSQNIPPQSGFYFECPDPAQGRVVGWEITTIENPECFR